MSKPLKVLPLNMVSQHTISMPGMTSNHVRWNKDTDDSGDTSENTAPISFRVCTALPLGHISTAINLLLNEIFNKYVVRFGLKLSTSESKRKKVVNQKYRLYSSCVLQFISLNITYTSTPSVSFHSPKRIPFCSRTTPAKSRSSLTKAIHI